MIKAHLQRFFNDRSPRQNRFELGFGTIYVFASRQGGLFLGLLAITFIAGVNYGNNLILGLFFYLLSIWLVSAIVTFLQLFPLSFELASIHLAPAKSIMWVELYLDTSAKASRQIELSFYPLNDKDLDKADHPWYEHLSDNDKNTFIKHKRITLTEVSTKTTVRLPILTDQRGVVKLPKLHIRSTYPLGVIQAWGYGFFADAGYAYPRPLAFDESQKSKALVHDHHHSNFYQKGQDDFDQLDTYKQGENLSRVSWGHLARGAGMLTKHFSDPMGHNYSIDYHAMPASLHEDKLSQMAHALLALKGQDLPIHLNLPNKNLTGMGDSFIDDCLLLLAKEP